MHPSFLTPLCVGTYGGVAEGGVPGEEDRGVVHVRAAVRGVGLESTSQIRSE